MDGAGNLFIADAGNSRVRKVSADGVVTTVAGNGSYGYSGDGGPALSASLRSPFGLAVDATGNLFIADQSNPRIRKVSADGVITTVAGNGSGGYSGDGGLALNAGLANPSGVAVDDAGNLFIADLGNHRIRKVSADGVITTVAGNGSGGYSGDGEPALNAGLANPIGVAVDGAGNLFVADLGSHRIRRISADGVITTVAGNGSGSYGGDGGPALSANLANPYGVAVDGVGNLFIADLGNHRMRSVSADGVITTVAGNGSGGYSGDGGPALNANLAIPNGVAVDGAGNMFIADTNNNRIRKAGADGVITTVAGNGTFGYSGDGGPATSTRLYNPHGVTVDGAGNLFIADTSNNRIRKVDADGVITTAAGNGSGGYSGDGGPALSASLAYPSGVAVDGVGNLFIADTSNNRIRKVDADGVTTTVAGNGASGFSGDDGPALNASLRNPTGVAVDGAGNLFIADLSNNRIRKVSTSGEITTVAGNGSYGYSGDGGPALSASLANPWGVAVDDAGNLFIADTNNRRIRKVTFGVPPALEPVSDAEVMEGGTLSFDLEATGSGQLAYSATGLPAGAVLDSSTGAFSYTPGFDVSSNASNAVFPVTFAVSNGVASAQQSMTITVLNVSTGTPAGQGVSVNPVDPETGESNVTIHFEEVLGGGDTTVVSQQGGPKPPSGFRIGNNTYFGISSGAIFNGPVQVCFDYGAFDVQENKKLALFHLVANGNLQTDGTLCDKPNGCWEDITQASPIPVGFPNAGAPNPDLANDMICGETASFSLFALVEALEVTAPAAPTPVGTPVTVSVDLGAADIDQAVWGWGDGEATPVVNPVGVSAAQHVYTEPGVYTVNLSLLKGDDEVGLAQYQFIVVYDPAGGFVTGGGWINSPLGGYVADPLLTGKANFGFVSKYKKGQSTPDGSTQFQFKAGGLNFESAQYDWLVVAGSRGQFKGSGLVNGAAGYGFMLSAIDGKNGNPDKFRIKIWEKASGTIVYDNQLGASEDAEPSTALGGGSITVHTKN